MRELFRQFSFPGGIPSHVAPETPGSIHEGGELGYALAHAYGAVLDNPDLLVACVVGDGEAETGPLAASWHSNKFINPARDGAVLPILHLNGYKIANPTVLSRISHDELDALMTGYGLSRVVRRRRRARRRCTRRWRPRWTRSRGAAPRSRTTRARRRDRAAALADDRAAHAEGLDRTGEVDGLPVEGTFRAHQVPLAKLAENPEHVRELEAWMRSYRPEELFDEHGRPRPEVVAGVPAGERRMGANPHANGGAAAARPRACPTSATTRSTCRRRPRLERGDAGAGRLAARGRPLQSRDSFRVFGPDETASNRLGAVIEETDRAWMADICPADDHVSPDGRVMEVLCEHLCQGWLEGYLLTGRHGLFNSYEAFIHIVDSMFNQHAKWLKTTRQIPWRRPIASLNYLLSSHVWRQDHNGFSHQDPGFIDHVVNKKAEIIRVYLPPDANCLLSVADHCLRSRHYVNVVVAGKQPSLDYLTMDGGDRALHARHRHLGLGVHRRRRRARRRARLRRRHPDAGDGRRRRDPARAPARAEGPRRQRRRPDAPAGRDRAPARPLRTDSSTRSSPPTSRSSSPTTAIRG